MLPFCCRFSFLLSTHQEDCILAALHPGIARLSKGKILQPEYTRAQGFPCPCCAALVTAGLLSPTKWKQPFHFRSSLSLPGRNTVASRSRYLFVPALTRRVAWTLPARALVLKHMSDGKRYRYACIHQCVMIIYESRESLI